MRANEKRIAAACVDMWDLTGKASNNGPRTAGSCTTSSTSCSTPTRPSMKCAGRSSSAKVDSMRGVVKGKRWLLLTRWMNLVRAKRQQFNDLFALNRKVFKAYVLKESLDRLWTYRYEGAMLSYLQRWIDQLRWQRLAPFQKLAEMLVDHLDGHPELLPHQSTFRRGGSHQREHQIPATPGPRL